MRIQIILQGGGRGGVPWEAYFRSFYYVNLISFIFRDESGPPPPPFFSFNLRMRFGDSNCNTDRLIFLIFLISQKQIGLMILSFYQSHIFFI